MSVLNFKTPSSNCVSAIWKYSDCIYLFFRVKILNMDQRMDNNKDSRGFSEFRLKIRRCKTIGTNRIELESLEQDFNTIDWSWICWLDRYS